MKQITLTIETPSGRKEVLGYEVVPGIAVYNTYCWWVTHSVSGLLIQSSRQIFHTQKGAVAYARKLILAFPLVDWTAEALELDKEMRSVVKKRFKILPLGGMHGAISEMLDDPRSKKKKPRSKKKKPTRKRA